MSCEETYIYREVPSGTIDGVNKTFTVINNIETLEEVFVWGAPYRNVSSIAGKTITLNDAPPDGAEINVDYFYN